MNLLLAALLISVAGHGVSAESAMRDSSGRRGVLVSTDWPGNSSKVAVLLDTVSVDSTLAHRELPGDNTGLDSIATFVHTAKRIEAWRLKPDTTENGIQVVGRARDDWRAPDLDRAEQAELEAVVRTAAESTAPCMAHRCLSTPAYRLMIYDESAQPVNMVMSGGCLRWTFSRGDRRLPRYCEAVPRGAARRLQALIAHVFFEKRGE